MSVSIEAYRAAIGLFNSFRIISISYFRSVSEKYSLVGTLLTVLFVVVLLIIMANDVELNPGPFSLLKFGHLNVRSLNNQDKFDELSLIIKDNNFHIFAISETWLNNEIGNDNFKIAGYNSIIRLDRNHRIGGGVALFSVDSIFLQRRHDLEFPGFEFLWAEFSVSGSNFLCGVCYRPPGNDNALFVNYLNGLQCMLDKIRTSGRNYKIIILGDFNAHYDPHLPLNSTEIGKQLNNFITINGLEQLISEPTRVTSSTSSFLDLLITNCSNNFLNTGTLSSPQNCDHSIIYGEMNISIRKLHCFQRDVWNFNNVDIANLNRELQQVDWSEFLLSASDIDVIYDKWYRCLRQIIEKYIPFKTVTIRPHDKPWMNSQVRLAIRKRNRFLSLHNKNPTQFSWERYRFQRNQTNYLIRMAKKRYFNKLNFDLCDSSLGNKKWWALAKQVYDNKTSLMSSALIENDISISDPLEKARIFNSFFVSQSKLDGADSTPPSVESFQTSMYISDIVVSRQDVYNLLKNVDTTKACGHDGVGNKIIQICCEGLSDSFTSFVNLSFRLGKFPYQWKLANVIPIFKKGNRHLKSNYRPVSLLPSLSKICEKLVFMQLYNFLLDIGFLYKYQSGFRPSDSTINQLIYITHQIYLAFESGKEVRVTFLDISKAFDKVWHAGLLKKLGSLGVRDPLLAWIKSYLTDRKQRVIIEGQSSEWASINAGVPQGSVLGPLLFLIYINDLTTELVSNPFIYADDTMLFEVVNDIHVSAVKLNEDLDRISDWSQKWLVTMNPTKCRSLVFSSKRDKPVHPALYLDGSRIEEVDIHTHLGLIFQSNMSWQCHIQNIYEKASKRLNVLKLLKYKLNRSTLSCLYKSLIRPLMEYGDVIWDNCTEAEANLLERIQYESARAVTGAIKGSSATRLLSELAWESLKTRREMHKLFYIFKIIKHTSPAYLVELLPDTVHVRTGRLLRSGENLTLLASRTEKFKQSFFPSSVKLWNSLQIDVRNSTSLNIFKVRLKSMYCPFSYKIWFNTSLNRWASVLHTRLRLGSHALHEHLFKINCRSSPLCYCGTDNETVEHFFLYCPRFAAQRTSLVASAVRICGLTWLESNDEMKVFYILNGFNDMDPMSNSIFFREVQIYILATNRFSPLPL